MPRNLFICDNNQHLYMQAFNIEIIDNQQFVIILATLQTNSDEWHLIFTVSRIPPVNHMYKNTK